jgi:lipoprotein-anchoring transpeptidase ErfK/SrfK
MSDEAVSVRANREVSSERPRAPWGAGRWVALGLGVIAMLVAVGAAGVAYATYDYAKDYQGRILPRTVIGGIDVSGLTRAEARERLRASIDPELDHRLRVTYGHRRWTVTARELGATSNVRRVLRDAVVASAHASFMDKMKMRMLGEELSFERAVVIRYPRAGVRGFVRGIASSLYRAPRDATMDYSTGWVRITPERDGRKVAVSHARSAIMKALHKTKPKVVLPVRTLEPEVTAARFREVLLVRIGENRLYLYENGDIADSWPVATGQPEYMTPTGAYEVTEKRYLPTWINPAPDTWGSDLPAEIPPGPGNPLGLRAINWSAPAIRFHGTEATYSLGYNASHGCVRMSNPDVVQLYDKINVGTPIVSVLAGPLKPLYVSAPDPTLVRDDSKEKSGKNEKGRN